jgi:hypothetical protein
MIKQQRKPSQEQKIKLATYAVDALKRGSGLGDSFYKILLEVAPEETMDLYVDENGWWRL